MLVCLIDIINDQNVITNKYEFWRVLLKTVFQTFIDCDINFILYQVTRYDSKQECKTVQDKVERQVPRQVCHDVPRKECKQVRYLNGCRMYVEI